MGLPAALAHTGFLATGTPGTSWLKVVESLAYALGVAPLALGYAASYALLWCNPNWRRRLEWLSPAGRMALTNYLMQTTIAIAIFFGVGFGLMGRVGPIWWVPLTITVL